MQYLQPTKYQAMMSFYYCAWHAVREYIRSENLDLSSCPCCNPDVSHHVASSCTAAWQNAAGLPLHMGLHYITMERTVINFLTFFAETLFGVRELGLRNSRAGALHTGQMWKVSTGHRHPIKMK